MDNIKHLIEMRNKLYDEYNYYRQNVYESQRLKDEIDNISDRIHYMMYMTPTIPIMPPDYAVEIK